MSILDLTIVDWLKQNFGDDNVSVVHRYHDFIMVNYKSYPYAVHVFAGAVVCNGYRIELSNPNALYDVVEHIRESYRIWGQRECS